MKKNPKTTIKAFISISLTHGKSRVSSWISAGDNLKMRLVLEPQISLPRELHHFEAFADMAPTGLIEYRISGTVNAYSALLLKPAQIIPTLKKCFATPHHICVGHKF